MSISPSPSPSISSIESPEINCKVCDKPGHGRHWGAFTCRACATFFRRYGTKSKFKPCKKENNCEILKNGYFNCKRCRLQKCREVGMKSNKLQIISKSKSRTIPPTVGSFIGRSNLIIFCAPQHLKLSTPKQVIDVRFLVDQASKILKTGSKSPIFAESSLEKLAYGMQNIRRFQQESTLKTITKFGKEETIALWQDSMIKMATWLTYFDEFQQLPHEIKMQILKGIWRVWSRLDRLITTMIGRRNRKCQDNMMMLDLEENQVMFSTQETEVDISWFCRYNVHQLKLFGYKYLDEKTEEMIEEMLSLEPSDVELSYMMCQLCFYYVGKRYQGTIMEVVDRLLEVLSNNLHDYYTNDLKMQKYSSRISGMMRINNQIQKGIYQRRTKQDLMRIFDVFYVEYSDPELFVDP